MKTESTSLTGLSHKKITTGLKRLQEVGITPDQWLKMLNARPAELQRIVAAWPGVPEVATLQGTGSAYDAVAILGFGPASAEPLPEAAPGELVIRVGAWSLKDLRSNETVIRKKLMWDDAWYDQYLLSSTKMTPGVYRPRLPVPDSNRKNFREQRKLLLPGEEVSPVALAATVLLVYLTETGHDLLNNDWCRCAETLPGGRRVALGVRSGRVRVGSYGWDGDRGGNVWLSASRKS